MNVYCILIERDSMGEAYTGEAYLNKEKAIKEFERLMDDDIKLLSSTKELYLDKRFNNMDKTFKITKKFKKCALEELRYGYEGEYGQQVIVSIHTCDIADLSISLIPELIKEKEMVFNSNEVMQLELIQCRLLAEEVAKHV